MGILKTPFCLSATGDYRLTFEASNSPNYGFQSWYFSSNNQTSSSKEITFSSKSTANSTIYATLQSITSYPTPYATPQNTYATPYSYPTPKSTPKPTTPPFTPTVDTTPPTAPGEFKPTVESSGFVRLGWSASSDESGVDYYEISRSTDGQNWAVIGDKVKELTYVDSDAAFAANYFYRVRAIDTKGNGSEYATTEVSTNSFSANITKDSGGQLSYKDGMILAEISANTVPEDTSCAISESSELVDAGDNLIVLSGPYQLACKNSTGEVLSKFDKPVQVTWKLDDMNNEAAQLKIVALEGLKWTNVDHNLADNTVSFELQNGVHFAAVSGIEGDSLFTRIALVLMILIGLGGGVLWALWIRYRRQQKASYNDYIKKHYGL